jgi:HSP20 family protein
MYLVKWQPRTQSVNRWDPFAEMADVQNWFDRAFGEFFGRTPLDMASAESTWSPLVDVHETKDHFLVKAELPGLKQEEIEVSIVEDTLTLKGERKRETEVKENEYHRIERSYGVFQRSIALPAGVDVNAVKASYKDGVLEIQLPKKEEVKPKTIKVEMA